MRNEKKSKELVLVGGGHAHVQVLKSLAMKGPRALRITLVSDGPTAYYSGMLPGALAGLYTAGETEADLVRLSRWAGVRFVQGRVTGLDRAARLVQIEGRPPLRYDLLSLDIGSVTRGADLPGVREHAILTRPIGLLLEKVETFERNFTNRDAIRIAVVGAGAAGVELAFAMRARFGKKIADTTVTLIDRGEQVLPDQPASVRKAIERALDSRGIAVRLGAVIERVTATEIECAAGAPVPHDLILWATGGGAQPAQNAFDLAQDPRGFIRVKKTLQSIDDDTVFAAGDMIHIDEHPDVPKAGVYAVRQGPILTANLAAMTTGGPLRAYEPQAGFLALLMTGDGSAVGSYKGFAPRGRWVWKWKDWIDRKWMQKFDPAKLGPSPVMMRAKEAAAEETPGEDDAMRCAGCGSKVSGLLLEDTLRELAIPPNPRVLRGLDSPDDAAVVRIPAGFATVQTVDSFRAFVDDPYLMGRIATLHAASDLFAMGAKPDTALANVTIPFASDELMRQDFRLVMSGIVEELNRMGATLVGGHTTEGSEITVGVSMTGLIDEARVATKGGARPGDALILTGAVGTGVLWAADMRAEAPGRAIEGAIASMLQSNEAAAGVLADGTAHALTDVTGFGLLGHLAEMLEASRSADAGRGTDADGGVGARIIGAAIPVLEGARMAALRGTKSTIDPANRERVLARWSVVGGTEPLGTLLFDPQTSGGLLAAVDESDAARVVEKLKSVGYESACVIGSITKREGVIEVESQKGAARNQPATPARVPA
ncbi:MAG: selenide, water dikinase SelD [Gemmatimonadetes bacterium]|nr:selenide, water dikinase SelD [Gemmatimonadota bacterium]